MGEKLFSSQFVCSALIQVTLIFCFLTIFFFTYAKDKEKDVVINNVDFVIEDLLGQDSFNLLPPDIREKLKGLSSTKKSAEMAEQDAKVEENNKQILNKTIKLLVVIIAFVCGITFFCWSKRGQPGFFYNFELGDILKESLIILFFIALTEFLFLNEIGSKYISVETNQLKANVIKNLRDYRNST